MFQPVSWLVSLNIDICTFSFSLYSSLLQHHHNLTIYFKAFIVSPNILKCSFMCVWAIWAIAILRHIKSGVIVGGVERVQHTLHLQYHDWGALEQGPEPATAPRVPQHKWLPTAPCVCVCTLCVCSLPCVCTLDGLEAEHKFQVWVTILRRMSRHVRIIDFQHL